ncbi:amino acid permease [Candidatus Micrarchaeota archaeon]|nr:amino acid permease [Candidatus Micrarchaeota archaeon]MBD3418410.1 amino acid permease [Candidatus Micrarchaeota archaeon]
MAAKKPARKKESSGKNKLGIFVLAMMTFAAIASLRGLPSMAEYGLSSAFFFVLVAIVFFIPVSLVSAELATGWPKRGGVYSWIKEAFGQRWGFLAIWLQWIQNVVWYPTVLSFAAGALAYIFNPALANEPLYIFGVIVAVYWGATLAAFRGMKLSGTITSFGAMAGTILPGILIILLGAFWVFSGNTSQIDFSIGELIPSDITHLSTIVFAASILLFFSGMEVSAVHAKEVKDPRENYPKAILIAAALTLGIFVLGTLSIAVVVPQAQISLVAGVMQAFESFFTVYGIEWMVPIIGVLIVFGAIGQVSAWIVGPSKGMLETAKEGTLPPLLQETNKQGVATHVMIVQGIIVTLLASTFLWMPQDVSSTFWLLTALTAQLYLIMYAMLFAAGIKLRYSKPNVKRPYKLPGGMAGMWLVAGIGALACVSAIGLGFIPPEQLEVGTPLFYDGFLAAGILVLGGAPLLIYQFRKPSWKKAAAKR